MANKTENAQDDIESLRESIEELSGSFNDKFSHLVSTIKKKSSEQIEAATNVVEKNPLKSVGVAVVCGLVIGFFLGKR